MTYRLVVSATVVGLSHNLTFPNGYVTNTESLLLIGSSWMYCYMTYKPHDFKLIYNSNLKFSGCISRTAKIINNINNYYAQAYNIQPAMCSQGKYFMLIAIHLFISKYIFT